MVEYRLVRLWADRVWLVKRWLEHPGLWLDGVDTKYERWYLGREAYWKERVGHLAGPGGWEGGVDDEAAFERWADGGVRSEAVGRPRLVEGEPWVEAGVSRRTWYRRKAERGEGGG